MAEFYVGHNITAPHPDPSSPLDWVEYAEQGHGYLELGGHRGSESWFLWQIFGDVIEIKELDAGGSQSG